MRAHVRVAFGSHGGEGGGGGVFYLGVDWPQ